MPTQSVPHPPRFHLNERKGEQWVRLQRYLASAKVVTCLFYERDGIQNGKNDQQLLQTLHHPEVASAWMQQHTILGLCSNF